MTIRKCPDCGWTHDVWDQIDLEYGDRGCRMFQEAQHFDANVLPGLKNFDAAMNSDRVDTKPSGFQPDPGENPYDADLTRRTFDRGQ